MPLTSIAHLADLPHPKSLQRFEWTTLGECPITDPWVFISQYYRVPKSFKTAFLPVKLKRSWICIASSISSRNALFSRDFIKKSDEFLSEGSSSLRSGVSVLLHACSNIECHKQSMAAWLWYIECFKHRAAAIFWGLCTRHGCDRYQEWISCLLKCISTREPLLESRTISLSLPNLQNGGCHVGTVLEDEKSSAEQIKALRDELHSANPFHMHSLRTSSPIMILTHQNHLYVRMMIFGRNRTRGWLSSSVLVDMSPVRHYCFLLWLKERE